MLSRCKIVMAAVLVCVGGLTYAGQDDVVAVVNGEAISRAEFGRSLVGSLGGSALETFVDRALVEQEAARLGVSVSDAELAARRELEVALRLRAAQQKARMGADEYRLALEGAGKDLARVRQELAEGISESGLRALLLGEKMLAPHLDLREEALRAYYERTRGPCYAAAHIVVRSRSRAEELLELLQDDPRLWERAVLEYSLDRSSVAFKGRVGPVPARSELGRVLGGMQPDELGLYGQGDFWHVLRLIGPVAPSPEGFDETKDELRAEVIALETQRRFQPLLALLNSRACVVVNLAGDSGTRLLGEGTAVFVNGQALGVSELARMLVDEFGRTMLGPYIERRLIMQEAHRLGLTVSPEELDVRMGAIGDQLFEEQAAQREVTAAGLTELLSRAGVDSEDFKRGLRGQLVDPEDVRATLLAEKMVADGVEVTEADIVEAYDELKGDRFAVKELAADSQAAAERMYREVKQGIGFELVARTEISEPGIWVPGGLAMVVTSSHPYYPYVKDLREGELSGIFKHDGKYRIIGVLGREPAGEPPPLESLRSALGQEVRLRKSRARIRALLVKLKAEAQIEVRLD